MKEAPNLATTKVIVDPVPRPKTIPLFRYSTVLSAASFLSPSWVKGEGTSAEKAFIKGVVERILIVGLRKKTKHLHLNKSLKRDYIFKKTLFFRKMFGKR